MPKLFLGEQEAQWFDVDIEPFRGDLRIKIRPSTRSLLDQVNEDSKKHPKYRRHTITLPDGRKITRDPDPSGAWVERFIISVIEDWEGVEDEQGPVECSDENKPRVQVNIALVNWITEKAASLAGVKAEAEEKN